MSGIKVEMTPRKLSFGYLYDFRNPAPWRRPWDALYAETLDLIVWSESAGFAGAWVPEHHLAEDGYQTSPLIALAAIAARTKTIRLGSAIALAPLYDPLRFAEDCAVLDHLSRGRADMALAIGYRRREYEAFGLDFTKRGARFDEFLHVVRALWAGESVTFEGKHVAVRNARLAQPPRNGRVPLYIGGFADKALTRVARYADGYIGNEDVCGIYLNKWKAAGKSEADARIRIQGLFFTVAHDPAQAMEELAPFYHYVNNGYALWLNEDKASGVDNVLKPMDLDAFKKSGILQIATPDQAIEKFKTMRVRAPVEHFMMMRPPGLPAERFQFYAELFARDVAPAFA